MKNRLIVLIILSISVLTYPVRGQNQAPGGLNGLSIKINPGMLAFFGDMSTEDWNPFTKIGNATKFGLAGGVIKQFTPWLGIQAQYTIGSLYSVKTVTGGISSYMSGSVTDFGLSLRLDPIHLFMKDKPTKISPYLSIGVATLAFRSLRREVGTNVIIFPVVGYKSDGITKNPKQNALAIPFAVGVAYQINDRISVELEHAYRFTNTDLLDALVGSTAVKDGYSLTSIGIRYQLASIAPSLSPVQRIQKTDRKANQTPRTRRTREVPTTRENQSRNNAKVKSVQGNIPLTNVFIESIVPENVTSGKIFDVQLRINKGIYKGPGKIIQKYPKGFTALESQGNYATFSFTNQTVVIDWEQMPADSIILYNYHVRVGESTSGSQTVSGRFEYQQPDGLKTNRFNNYVFVDNNLENQMDRRVKEILGENTKSIETEADFLTEPKSKDLNSKIDELLVEYGNEDAIKAAENLNNNNKNKVVPFTSSTKGIEYKIQVGAFNDRTQGGSRLSSKYGIRETMTEEINNGMYKYTIGHYKTYQEAERARDAFIQRTKLWSAFIVAYKDGKRVVGVANTKR